MADQRLQALGRFQACQCVAELSIQCGLFGGVCACLTCLGTPLALLDQLLGEFTLLRPALFQLATLIDRLAQAFFQTREDIGVDRQSGFEVPALRLRLPLTLSDFAAQAFERLGCRSPADAYPGAGRVQHVPGVGWPLPAGEVA